MESKIQIGDIVLIAGGPIYLVIDCKENNNGVPHLRLLNLETFICREGIALGFIPSSLNLQKEKIDLSKIFKDIIYNNI